MKYDLLYRKEFFTTSKSNDNLFHYNYTFRSSYSHFLKEIITHRNHWKHFPCDNYFMEAIESAMDYDQSEVTALIETRAKELAANLHPLKQVHSKSAINRYVQIYFQGLIRII